MSRPQVHNYEPPLFNVRVILQTGRGVTRFQWGMMVYVFVLLIFLADVILTFVFAEDFLVANYGEFPENSSLALGSCGLLCGWAVFYLIAIVLWFVGLDGIHRGKDEFGIKHASRVPMAVKYIALYLALLFTGLVLTFVLSMDVSASMGYQTYLNRVRANAVAGGIIEVAQNTAFGLGAYNLVFELCDDRFKRILRTAVLVLVALTITGTATSIAIAYGDFLHRDIYTLARAESIFGLTTGLGFIPVILFVVCFNNVSTGIRDGRIRPVPAFVVPRITAVSPDRDSYYPGKPLEGQLDIICPVCGSSTLPSDYHCAKCGTRIR